MPRHRHLARATLVFVLAALFLFWIAMALISIALVKGGGWGVDVMYASEPASTLAQPVAFWAREHVGLSALHTNYLELCLGGFLGALQYALLLALGTWVGSWIWSKRWWTPRRRDVGLQLTH